MGDWLGLAVAVPVDFVGVWLGLAVAVPVGVVGDWLGSAVAFQSMSWAIGLGVLEQV